MIPDVSHTYYNPKHYKERIMLTKLHGQVENLTYDECYMFIKKMGYSISILDRSTGLIDLSLIYGVDMEYTKEFTGKYDTYLPLFQKAIKWIIEVRDKNNIDYIIDQIKGKSWTSAN